jgi:cyclopropane-fatty-acyl-phospholipid synthase
MKAIITVHSSSFYWSLIIDGSVGAAESYVQKEWDVNNLENLIRIFAANKEILNSLDGGVVNVKHPLRAIRYWMERNSLEGSKKNIMAHYDLSNDLFKSFLDEKMMYSSAFFTGDESLEEAQDNKLRRICEKLSLNPEDKVLEIGTGWGGLAIFMAKHYGCQVTTTTISENQYSEALKRVKAEGLEDKVKVLPYDYRDLKGSFDKVVSIEMIEAVGEKYLDVYLKKISTLLKSDGLALIQAITINDQEYSRAVKEVDFIKKFIFPGSFIPSIEAIMKSSARTTDLRLYHLEDFTSSYSKTLEHWRKRFFANKNEVMRLGFKEDFIRLWDFYFCYCSGGFKERAIGVSHLVFGGPDFRGDLSQKDYR